MKRSEICTLKPGDRVRRGERRMFVVENSVTMEYANTLSALILAPVTRLGKPSKKLEKVPAMALYQISNGWGEGS